MDDKRKPRSGYSGVFYSVLGGWLKPKAGYRLLIAVQPFTNEMANLACRNSDSKRYDYAMQQQITKNENAINVLNSDTFKRRGTVQSRSDIDDMGMYELSGDKPGNGAYKAFSFGKKGIEWNYPVIVGTQYGDNRRLYSYVMQSADGQNYSPTDYVALATMDDLDEHFQSTANYDYIFSKGTHPRASIIRTSSGEVILRSSTDSSNYLQLRINNTGVYADWIENGASVATKTIITKV